MYLGIYIRRIYDRVIFKSKMQNTKLNAISASPNAPRFNLEIGFQMSPFAQQHQQLETNA